MYLRNATVGSVVDPITGEKQEKAVFVVFFAGERARTKILKVPCLGIAITLRMCPWGRGGGGVGVKGVTRALSGKDPRGELFRGVIGAMRRTFSSAVGCSLVLGAGAHALLTRQPQS